MFLPDTSINNVFGCKYYIPDLKWKVCQLLVIKNILDMRLGSDQLFFNLEMFPTHIGQKEDKMLT